MSSFTKQDAKDALGRFCTMKFPPPEIAHASLVEEICKMFPSREALDWTVDRLVAMPIPWPGIGEVRGLLCMKFDPLDGLMASCSLPGYSAEENEMRYIEAHERRKLDEKGDGPLLNRLRLSDRRPS